MGTDAAHEEGVGRITPQGGPQDDREATIERTGPRLGLPLLDEPMVDAGLQEVVTYTYRHQNTVAQYISTRPIMDLCPVSGEETEAGTKGGNEMVVTGRFGFGGDADGGLRGGTERKEGGYRQERDVNGRLINCEDTVAKISLRTKPNATFDYALGLEIHHPIISTIGAHRNQLERKRYPLQLWQMIWNSLLEPFTQANENISPVVQIITRCYTLVSVCVVMTPKRVTHFNSWSHCNFIRIINNPMGPQILFSWVICKSFTPVLI